MTLVRIATRTSQLAMWQAEYVKQALQAHHPKLQVELVGIVTQADKMLNTSLAKIGGKGLFVKELETALLENRADIAVHSIKDIPAEFPADLMLSTILERDDPRDCLIAVNHANLAALPKGAVVGTSSLRRQCLLKAMRPDLRITLLRGNVNTRLAKLQAGDYDAIILAAAGLKRLNKTQQIKQYFAVGEFTPAIGQGAIGIESRIADLQIQALLMPLDHQPTRQCIVAERALSQRFGGNCQTPIAAHADIADGQLTIAGMIGMPDGTRLLRAQQCGDPKQAVEVGRQLAEQLIDQGAWSILTELMAASSS